MVGTSCREPKPPIIPPPIIDTMPEEYTPPIGTSHPLHGKWHLRSGGIGLAGIPHLNEGAVVWDINGGINQVDVSIADSINPHFNRIYGLLIFEDKDSYKKHYTGTFSVSGDTGLIIKYEYKYDQDWFYEIITDSAYPFFPVPCLWLRHNRHAASYDGETVYIFTKEQKFTSINQ